MDNEATCSLGPMSDRPLSVHVRAASLLWKKLKLSGLSNNSRYNFEDDDKENEKSTKTRRRSRRRELHMHSSKPTKVNHELHYLIVSVFVCFFRFCCVFFQIFLGGVVAFPHHRG